MPLSDTATSILQYLVTRLGSGEIRAEDPRTYPKYGAVHSTLRLPMQGNTVGESLNRHGLTEIAQWAARQSHPAITGLVVDAESLMPGKGFFELHGRPADDFRWWMDEVKRCLAFNWTAVLTPATRTAQADSIRVMTDFSQGACGWHAGFTDYSGGETDYQLASGIRAMPAEAGAGTAFYVQGMNRSDDLFMYLARRLGPEDGLAARRGYTASFTVQVASNAPTGAAGIGGAPGEGVVLKVGASPLQPAAIWDDGFVRFSLDKGHQHNNGDAATMIGNIANGRKPADPLQYVMLTRQGKHAHPVATNDRGEMWIFIGTDSGFEGFTALYYKAVEVVLSPQP